MYAPQLMHEIRRIALPLQLGLMLVILSAPVAHAASIPIDYGGGTIVAPSGQLTTVTVHGAMIGGTMDTIIDARLGPPDRFVSVSPGFVEDLYVRTVTWEWDANGDGLGLDVTALDGLSMYRGSSDLNALTVRLFTSPLDVFLLNTTTKSRDAIGDCFPCMSSEGIYTLRSIYPRRESGLGTDQHDSSRTPRRYGCVGAEHSVCQPADPRSRRGQHGPADGGGPPRRDRDA